jgi:hypothetical protein
MAFLFGCVSVVRVAFNCKQAKASLKCDGACFANSKCQHFKKVQKPPDEAKGMMIDETELTVADRQSSCLPLCPCTF